MANNEAYKKPKGYIEMVLHNGGTYDIKTNSFSEDAKIIEKIEFPNLIVLDASILMAMRMAPGSTTSSIYDEENNDFVNFGLTHLAIGKGEHFMSPNVNKLDDEICRKSFDSWSFIDSSGDPSEIPTNILKLSTTFTNEPHDGTDDVAPITEMGLFGGTKDFVSYDPDDSSDDMLVHDKDGGIMFNYKTFPVWNKPASSSLTINWKITF